MIRLFFTSSIKNKLVSIILFTCAVVLLSAFTVFTAIEAIKFSAEVKDNLIALADIIGKNTSSALLFKDEIAATETLKALSAKPNIFAAYVITKDEKLFARYIAKGANKAKLNLEPKTGTDPSVVNHDVLAALIKESHSFWDFDFAVAKGIFFDDQMIGTVVIYSDASELFIRLKGLLLMIVVIMSGAFLLAYILSTRLQRLISRPILYLAQTMRTVSHNKNYSIRIQKESGDEIGQLFDGFNDMFTSLEEYNSEIEERTSELTSTNQQLRQEIAARKLAEEQLLHDAFHDALTGLPNRVLFMDRLAHTIAIAKRREDYFFAVLFLDLDRFKVINDSLGHIIGDQLLIELGKRLLTCLRPGDTIARLGGDEFVILLEDIRDVLNITRIVKRIENEMILPCNVAGHEIFATASIGIALSSTGYDLPEDILRDADTAMYHAKAQGRANYVVFESSMHIHAVERLQLDTDLRKAVERKEFVVYYQPILSIKTNSIIGFEALARWKHPERGIINPADFIPIAEETGLIVSIDRLVLREACKQMHEWQAQFPENSLTFISVNLSNKQLSQPDIVEYVSKILKETGIDPGSLKLEITENVIIENPEFTSATLSQLKALGVLIYIDDFGTGYSSLSYLHRFPIDGLKIDRSFIRRMGDKGENQEIIKTIMLLAKDLNITAIAEGIETANQLAQIKSLQCKYWQGYHFSKPVESEQAKALIESKPAIISE